VAVGYLLILLYHRAITDQAPDTYHRLIADDAAHPDHNIVPHRSGVDHIAVADGHPIADVGALTRTGVDHAVVLYAGIVTHHDSAIVPPQTGPRSDPAHRADGHITEHIGRGVDVALFADARDSSIKAA
jgi:hypothetical protein